jgi:hypothetical protein
MQKIITFNNLKADKIEAKFKKEYADITDDAKEHAEHIGIIQDK